MTAKHMCVCVSQNSRDSKSWKLSKLSSCEIHECLRKEKRLCPFSSLKPRPKKGKKTFSCEAAADLASSSKSSFFNQDEWLREIEEHKRKPDTSEKQSDFASIFTDLDRIPKERCFFYCVIWNCFL